MSTTFETLRALAARLTRDHLDEDDSEVEVPSGRNTRRYQQRTVTLRGELDGVPIVVMHQRYYFRTLAPPVAHDVIEVFTTDRSVTYEGTVRRRDGWRWLQRWFGGGGLDGSHPLYERFVLDFTMPGDARRLAYGFEDRLLHHLDVVQPIDLTMQADVGISGVHRHRRDVDAIEALVREQSKLWRTLIGG